MHASHFASLILCALEFCSSRPPAAQAAPLRSLLRDGNFERPSLRLSNSSGEGIWTGIVHGESDAAFALAEGEGRDSSRCVRFSKTAAGNQNIHLDQIVPVRRDTIHEVRAWVRGDGKLRPVVCVTDVKWKPLLTLVCDASEEWTEVRGVFNSFDGDQVRFEWFAGAQGKLYQGVAGTSWLDDVTIAEVPSLAPTLKQAFEVVRPKSAEIDLNAIQRAPIGKPTPLRPIRCEDGVLVYDDGTEVALWGVNLQTALSWEYNGRMRNCGVPLDAEALKEIADANIAELQQMGLTVVRMHLLPCDFSDAEGNVRDSVFLDVLDYTVARCNEAGIYVYLTLLNEMNQWYQPDAFLAKREREEWVVSEELVRKTERYIHSFLTRENRYTKRRYCDDPALAVIEVMNEPGYVDFAEMQTDERFAELRERFAAWCRERELTEHLATQYRAFRYEYVRAYVDRMATAIRGSGAKQPVAWNLNWPRMIRDHEDVFQAVADSSVDVVSFCCYPGQSDVPQPFWQHPRDLSRNNYLPFLRGNYQDYDRLRWLLTKRFAGKAKAVYEFETFYNQTSYLYPAMAHLFRSLGAQIAQMWTYSLTPTAEYMQGSHHLNLYCTPPKAVSFMIAGEVFAATPRYTPYPDSEDDPLVFGDCAVSFEHGTSVLQTADKLVYSGPMEWCPFEVDREVNHIVGIGSSPLIEYDGTGAYFVRVGDDEIDLTVNPDATFLLPPWDKQKKRPWELVCKLDSAKQHRLALHLPGWERGCSVWRVEGDERVAVPAEAGALSFPVRAGSYQVRRR